MRIKSLLILGVIVAVLALAAPALAAPLSFEVTYDAAAGAAPVDGRIIVVAADQFYADWGYPEPRYVPEGEGPATPPFWGKTVAAMAPGSTVTLGAGADVYGYPLPTIAELPEGDYWVQAVLNKYTTFDRADGFSIKAFLPGGSDYDVMDNPGSLYSDPQLVHIDPDGGPIALSLTHVVEPQEPVPQGGVAAQGNPTDSKHVKHVKIKSELLSEFWGQDMYPGADVPLRERRYRRAVSEDSLTGPAYDDPCDIVARWADLEAALDRLPVEQRILILLVPQFGYDYRAAGEVAGVPEGTVSSRLAAARVRLRGLLVEPACVGE